MATILAERASLDTRPVPRWYTNAKLGIFVHWGMYSIPAFAEPTDGDYTAFMRDLTAGRDTRDLPGSRPPTTSGSRHPHNHLASTHTF